MSYRRQELQQVVKLYATSRAFCALRKDGRVVAWGGQQLANYGGDASKVQEQLTDVVSVRASGSAFAALRASGWPWPALKRPQDA